MRRVRVWRWPSLRRKLQLVRRQLDHVMRERVRRRRAAPRLLAKQGAWRALHGAWVWRLQNRRLRPGRTTAQQSPTGP